MVCTYFYAYFYFLYIGAAILIISLLQAVIVALILCFTLKNTASEEDKDILKVCYIPIISYLGLIEMIELKLHFISDVPLDDLGESLYFKICICFITISILLFQGHETFRPLKIITLIMKQYKIVASIFGSLLIILISLEVSYKLYCEYKLRESRIYYEFLQSQIQNSLSNNEKIKRSRNNQNPILSFKKVQLSMDFSQIDELVKDKISESEYFLSIENAYNLLDTIQLNRDVSVQIFNLNTTIRYLYAQSNSNVGNIGDNFSNAKYNSDSKGKCIRGKLKTFDSDFQNLRATVHLFENDDKVAAIYVDLQGYDNAKLKTLKELYSKKYGEPEKFIVYDSELNQILTVSDCFYWRFANGIIYISKRCILYVENSFLDLLNRSHERIRSNQKSMEEVSRLKNIEVEREMRKAAAEKAKRDSLQKVINLQKTFEDI
jgi:hypothetical protein